jgi:hypothetical protein
MSSMNENFPIPRDSEKDEHDIDETEHESVVYEDLFPRVVIVQMQSPIELSPPPIDTVMGQDDGSHDFTIKRRRLSYLCNILRSWQRGVTSQSVITFPEFTDVRDATDTTTRNIIVFDYHRLSWRSGVEFLSKVIKRRWWSTCPTMATFTFPTVRWRLCSKQSRTIGTQQSQTDGPYSKPVGVNLLWRTSKVLPFLQINGSGQSRIKRRSYTA